MLSRPAAAGYQLLRWAIGGLMIAAWLWQPALRALIFIVILAAAYFAALRVPNRHAVPWERLIATEKNQGTRALMMLGWFVDVPGREQRVYARRYLSRWGGGIAWKRDSAYRFLLTKSFARGDVFGIVLRIAVLGMLLVLWNRSSYAGTGIYLFFLFIIGIQLSALRKLHSESFWLTVYPLPAGSRADSTTQFIFRTLLVTAALLGWPFLFTLAAQPFLATLSLLAGALLAFFQSVHAA